MSLSSTGGEQDLVEVDGPNAVSDLLEANVEVPQGLGEEDQLVAESWCRPG